jgi:3-oxoacid CoA-transferase B subunit
MDLVAGVKKIIVLMEHNAKDGTAKLVKQCSLPLTGVKVVDMIITELGVFNIEDGKLYLDEIAPEITQEEIAKRTEAAYQSRIK